MGAKVNTFVVDAVESDNAVVRSFKQDHIADAVHVADRVRLIDDQGCD